MGRWSWLVLSTVLFVTRVGEAAADEVQGTRSELVRERAHEIRVVLDHGDATLTVRRTVHNGGDRHDQAIFWIDVPQGAVATGLRTKGTLHGQPFWFEGELLEAEAAAARYRELTGVGGYYPKDPALLSWRSQAQLALQVFPVAPATEKTVEYTLRMPMAYSGGRHRLSLPQIGTAELRATMTVAAADVRDQLFVGDEPVGSGTRIELDHEVELSLARRDPPRIDGGLAVVPIGGDRSIVHLDLEAAARLSTIPQDARIVVAIDTSRSMDEAAIEAAIGMTRAYLSHFEHRGARVEVVGFDRDAHPRHGKFVGVDEALADLEHFQPKPRNGSRVDAALAHATRLFAKEGRSHARRIVLFTDALARERLTPALVQAYAARTGAIVHVVDAAADDIALMRADDHPWIEAARATGGLAWNASFLDEPSPRAQAIFEELARPIRIDALAIAAPGLESELAAAIEQLEDPDAMNEGTAITTLALVDHRVRHVVLTGELWSTPIRKVMAPARDEGTLWAALVLGSELLGNLAEPEMMVLAMRGHAVSPVTSYLAIEPGVRPSTEGLEWASGIGSGGGGTGQGTIGLGSVGTIGRGGHAIDPQKFLDGELLSALVQCGAGDRTGSATLQTTLAEIVEIDDVAIDGPTEATLRDCVRERLWAIELPGVFTSDWQRWTAQA